MNYVDYLQKSIDRMKINLKSAVNDPQKYDIILSEIDRTRYHIRRYKRQSTLINNDLCPQDFYDEIKN